MSWFPQDMLDPFATRVDYDVHLITAWDGAAYVCSCGNRSETATDHELHERAVQRGEA